jgi:acyl carrier protein
MGLEAVEIVLAAEETFGIAIPDEAAAEIRTPADLIGFIASHVPSISTEACTTQQMFYRLRKGFRSQVPALLNRFDPETELATIVHKDQWPRVWLAVRTAVGGPGWPESVPWPGLLRDGPKTIRQLIWHLAASLPRPAHGETWPRFKIEAEVRRIIAEVLGKKDFRLSAKFVGELGVS